MASDQEQSIDDNQSNPYAAGALATPDSQLSPRHLWLARLGGIIPGGLAAMVGVFLVWEMTRYYAVSQLDADSDQPVLPQLSPVLLITLAAGCAIVLSVSFLIGAAQKARIESNLQKSVAAFRRRQLLEQQVEEMHKAVKAQKAENGSASSEDVTSVH
ncbi:MAG: hypothetical protein RIK87_20480 [Fuerstiella sp.]